jgi:acyl carrier protein
MKNGIKAQIQSFIVDNFLFGESPQNLKETDSFLDTGIIDSTGVLELVSYIEETYGFQVEDEELIPENLDSIANVTAYVMRKKDSKEERA